MRHRRTAVHARGPDGVQTRAWTPVYTHVRRRRRVRAPTRAAESCGSTSEKVFSYGIRFSLPDERSPQMTAGSAHKLKDDPLHWQAGPDHLWTTVNTAEALPGVMT